MRSEGLFILPSTKHQANKRRLKARKQEGLGKTRMAQGTDPQRYATMDMRKQIRERDKDCCRYCQRFVGLDGQFDHVVAHSRGGATVITNLVLTCIDCNIKKGSRHNMRPKNLNNHLRGIARVKMDAAFDVISRDIFRQDSANMRHLQEM